MSPLYDKKTDGFYLTNMKKYTLITLGLLLLVGCKDSTWAQWHALGAKHRITLYGATGVPIKTWESTGNVSNEDRSDGWYFKDVSTGKLVEVTGTLVIEQE